MTLRLPPPPSLRELAWAVAGVVLVFLVLMTAGCDAAGAQDPPAPPVAASAPAAPSDAVWWGQMLSVAALATFGGLGIGAGGVRRLVARAAASAAAAAESRPEPSLERLDERSLHDREQRSADQREIREIRRRLHRHSSSHSWTQGALYMIADKLAVKLPPLVIDEDPIDSEEGAVPGPPTDPKDAEIARLKAELAKAGR